MRMDGVHRLRVEIGNSSVLENDQGLSEVMICLSKMNQMPQHKGTFSEVSFTKSLKGFLSFFHRGSYLLKESVYVFSDVSLHVWGQWCDKVLWSRVIHYHSIWPWLNKTKNLSVLKLSKGWKPHTEFSKCCLFRAYSSEKVSYHLFNSGRLEGTWKESKFYRAKGGYLKKSLVGQCSIKVGFSIGWDLVK